MPASRSRGLALTTAVLVATITVAGAALAQKPLDSNSQIRLGRARDALAGLKIRADLRGDVPVARADEVIVEQRRVQLAVDEAENQMMMVRDKRHPDVAPVAEELARYRAYLKDLDTIAAKHKTALQATAALRGKFFNEFWDDHRLLDNFYPLIDDPNLALRYAEAKDLVAAKEALARIHAGCTGPYKELAHDPTAHPNDRTRRPDLMCKAAAMGGELVKRRVVGVAREMLDQILKSFEAGLKSLPSDDGNLKGVDKLALYDAAYVRTEFQKRYGADLALVGVEVPADVLAEVDAARAALLAELPKQVSRWKWGGHGSPGNDPYVKKAYEQAEKGVKVLKMQLYSTQWEVRVNALGVPEHRRKYGGVLFKIPGESWCHEDPYTYFQDYQGHKRYGASYFNNPPRALRHTRIVACE